MSESDNNNKLVLAILSISILMIMASTAVSPVLSSIKEVYPDISDTYIKLVLTLPSLVMIPFCLLSGWISMKINKKWLIVGSIIIYVIFGVSGGFTQSFLQLIITRAFLGISIGILMPLSNTLIFDLIREDKQSKTMGLSVSMNQLAGILFLSLAGWLASLSWRYSFYLYFLSLIPLVLVLFWLPSIPPIKKVVQSATQSTFRLLNWKIFALSFLAMMSSVTFIVVYTDLALYIQQEKKVFSSSVGLVKDKETLATIVTEGHVNEELIENFKQRGVTLAADAVIQEIDSAKEWHILNGQKEYVVYKANDTLQVKTVLGTSEMAGYALALMGIPAAIAGLILSFLLKRIRNYLMPASALIMAIGYYLLGSANSYAMILFAVLFIGFSGGLLSSSMMLLVPKLVSPQIKSLGIAIMSTAVLLGQFVSPLYTVFWADIFQNDTFQFKFFIITITLLVFALSGTLYLLYINSRQTK